MPENRRPRNIVWITTDHMRYDSVGANGNPAIRTPNLDRLARDGVSLEQCYAQNPVCMPSRVSFMTGQYPCRTGVLSNGPAFPPERGPTCAEIFRGAGYLTAQLGKLHFEPHMETDLDPEPARRYGFDYMALSEEPGSYDDAHMRWLRANHPEYVDVMRVPRPIQRAASGGSFAGWTVEAPGEVSHSGFAASAAMDVLAMGRRTFAHVGMYAPHPPLNPPREIYELYEDVDLPAPQRREGEGADKPPPLSSFLRHHEGVTDEAWAERRRYFYAMCTLVDRQVGRLLGFLEDWGELDDTLILFMSDHGDMDGDHGMIGKQASFYEDVMRLPVILHWPAGLEGGQRPDDLVEAVDLLPTLCDLAGVPVPPEVQGRSIAPQLMGEEGEPRQDALAMHGAPFGSICAMLRSADTNYIRYGPGAEVLYNLAEEPGEYTNHAGDESYADRLHAARERLLQRMLEAAGSGLRSYRRY